MNQAAQRRDRRRVRGIGIIIPAMGVSLERKAPWWPSAIVIVALAGIGATILAYLTPERTPAKAVSTASLSSPTAPATPAPTGASGDGKIHVPLFVDPALVKPTPRFRFTFDPPEALAKLRQEEKIDEIVAGAATDMDRGIRLMHWTRSQWEPGVPNPYPPLDARVILRDIRRGFTSGFCAQYNYVLAQALQSIGIPARYVSLVEHEVIEMRPGELGRWVCLDPLYDAWYQDVAGQALSVHDIHQRVRRGSPIIASEGNRLTNLKTQLAVFNSFAVWLKNDHVSSPLNFADLDRYKVYFLDEPAQAAQLPRGALTTTVLRDLYPDLP